jgi:hypothetical protein
MNILYIMAHFTGSQEEIDQKKIETLFPYCDYENFDALRVTSEGPWLRIIVKSKDGNLLTRPVLEELQSFYNHLYNISVEEDFERFDRRIGRLDNRTDNYTKVISDEKLGHRS